MITKGDLPPNSSVTGLRLLLAANSSTIFPVSVDPVNASFVEGKKYMITHSVLLFWPSSIRKIQELLTLSTSM